jgi:hypothetical protein
MGNVNYFSGIVKILENPNQTFLNSKVAVTRIRVELPQRRNNRLAYLIFWGNLAKDAKNMYKTNDYILVEGYVSIRNKNNTNPNTKSLKKLTITVLKVYPFLLQENRLYSKK